MSRSTIVLCLVMLAALAVPSPAAAAAGSIVFTKGGNLWLDSPDGSVQHQLTTGGGAGFASQADGGTILASVGTYLVRLDRDGHQLGSAIATDYTGAPAGWVGAVYPVISPDGVHQAYDGERTTRPIYDPICNCYTTEHTFATNWGSASTFSQPNQTLGQEDYDEPAWIDDSHLLLSSTGILIDQVATYTLGGGDNTLVQWFSDPDPNVQALASGAITRAGDKLAFVANVNGGVGNEIRIYSSTGSPPLAAGDPSNVPVDQCNIGPNNFEPLRVSFSPDGQSLAYDAPDGIHLVTLTGFPSCAGLSDKLIIAGGVDPYFGPTNVPPTPPPPPPVARCDVPRLRGLGMAAARGRLVRAHCRLGQVRIAHSARGRHGKLVVISQQPSAGPTRGPNTKVSIVLGPPARKRHHR